MKAKLEESTVTYRGVVIEAETDEERVVLKNIWNNHGRPVAFENGASGIHLKITIAPTPESK